MAGARYPDLREGGGSCWVPIRGCWEQLCAWEHLRGLLSGVGVGTIWHEQSVPAGCLGDCFAMPLSCARS